MILNLKQAIANQPDGIVVMGRPGDDAYFPFIEQAVNQGIIVTSVDTMLSNALEKFRTQGFGYVGTDNYLQGKIPAEETLRKSNLQAGDRALVWGLKNFRKEAEEPRQFSMFWKP
ncbi:MAG: hypothetical protein ACOCXO_07730 [Bacteroidota bacterium]